GAAGEDAQGQVGAVDPVGEAGAVQAVEGPAHRLAVRGDQVEGVQPCAVRPVLHAGHDAVHGERRQREGTPRPGGVEHRGGGRVVVDDVDEDAEDAAFAGVYHGVHLSTFAS